jgi:hypothetical protein
MNPNALERIVNEAKRIEEDCTFNFMGHYEAANRWDRWDHFIGFPNAFLCGVTAFTVFPLPTIATALGIVTTLLSLVTLYLRPAYRSIQHYRSGGRFKALREKTRLFREIDLASAGIDETNAIRRIKELSEEKRVSSELAVPLPDFAYVIAKRKIEAGQASYDVDNHAKYFQ